VRPQDAIQWHSTIATQFDGRYERDSDFAARSAAWIPLIDKYSDPRATALDVGCGSGAFIQRLAERNRHVLAIDASTGMLDVSRTKVASLGLTNVELRCCDIGALEEGASPEAELIICSSVLEYVDDLTATLELLLRLLRGGGVIIFSLPNADSFFRRVEPSLFRLFGRPRYYRYLRNVRTRIAMEGFLHAHGYRVLESAYYAGIPGLSSVVRPLGLQRYTENLFLVVAQRP